MPVRLVDCRGDRRTKRSGKNTLIFRTTSFWGSRLGRNVVVEAVRRLLTALAREASEFNSDSARRVTRVTLEFKTAEFSFALDVGGGGKTEKNE